MMALIDPEVKEWLDKKREAIDAVDEEIRELIGDRNDLVSAVQMYKSQHGLPAWDQKRVDQILDLYSEDFGPVDGYRIGSAILGTEEEFKKNED